MMCRNLWGSLVNSVAEYTMGTVTHINEMDNVDDVD